MNKLEKFTTGTLLIGALGVVSSLTGSIYNNIKSLDTSDKTVSQVYASKAENYDEIGKFSLAPYMLGYGLLLGSQCRKKKQEE